MGGRGGGDRLTGLIGVFSKKYKSIFLLKTGQISHMPKVILGVVVLVVECLDICHDMKGKCKYFITVPSQATYQL